MPHRPSQLGPPTSRNFPAESVTRGTSDVIDPSFLPAAEAIGPTLEGKTERQKNLHPSRSLAWLMWIIARLGGWSCYCRLPGLKTMGAGWAQFATMTVGFAIAASLKAESSVRIR
jgi:hypothetical protein